MSDNTRPLLSLVVVGHAMPRQLANTLHSLSPGYQRGVSAEDYEVIVVENDSDAPLPDNVVKHLDNNFQYHLREETGVSPAPAINFGMARAQGQYLGLLIDGARLLSPRVIKYALMAFRMTPNALVMVPGYHLGEADQKSHASQGHSEDREKQMLEELNWREDGYRLFQYCCFSSSNQRGYLQPMQECNALFAAREAFEAIHGADERFNLEGGGSLNLHIYRSLGLLPDTQLFVLPGEGSFHQFHHGVTTSEVEDRETLLNKFKTQLDEIWNHEFRALTREPILLGSVTRWATLFLEKSTVLAQRRFDRLAQNQRPYWPDDARFERWTENDCSDTDESRQWRIEHTEPDRFWQLPYEVHSDD